MSFTSKAGVVGAGVFGAYHAAKYAQMANVVFVGVYDPHPDRAQSVVDRFGGQVFSDLDQLIAATNLISVTTPASAHGRVGLQVIAAGNHVYIEKPLASTLQDADAIVSAAAQRGLVAACGFLERATFEAMGLNALPQAPIRMESVRNGVASPRNLDVSVVLDLMIHDIDLALTLAQSEPLTVEAEGRTRVHASFDEAKAEVMFISGLIATLAVNRVAPVRERTMKLTYPVGEIFVDFVANRIENSTPFALNHDFERTAGGADRLGASLAAFVSAVRQERPGPLASAADGARALELALAVEQAIVT